MNFTDFLPHVLPSVGGCPDLVALDHIVKAVRIFCARTLVWNYTANPILSAQGVADYTLQIGKGQELVRVLAVDVDGDQYLIPTGPAGRRAARNGDGNICVMKGLQDFTLSPAPTVDGLAILTDLAVKPELGGDYWPDDFSEYVTDIAAGAIATLCLIPRQEWTDKALAELQQQMFNNRIGVVAMKVSKGLGVSKQGAHVVWY